MGGKTVAVPPFEGKAQRIANSKSEVEPLREHVGNFAAGFEVVYRPLVSGLLNHPHNLLTLFVRAAGGREGRHVVYQRLGADGNLVAEDGGYLVGVAGAADVSQQRDPIDGVAHFLIESSGLTYPHREQARPKL